MKTIMMKDFSIFDLKNQITFSLLRKLNNLDCSLSESIDVNPSEMDILDQSNSVSCIIDISNLCIDVAGFPFKLASVSFEFTLEDIEWSNEQPTWEGAWNINADLYNHSLAFSGSDDDEGYFAGDSYDEDYGFFHEDDDKHLNKLIVEACLFHLTSEANKRFTSLIWNQVKKYAEALN